ASTHRVYSMTERTAMGDGRVDAQALIDGARAAARQLVSADFGALAERTGSLISPVLCGALAASGALPFSRAQFEATIERAGVGVKASLQAFAAGFDAASGTAPDTAFKPAGPQPGPRLAVLSQRVRAEFPPPAHATLNAALVRLAD